MIEYLNYGEVIRIHERVLETGGLTGIKDKGAIESAVSQPTASFAGEDLYATLHSKAACTAFQIARNHPFVDGNKRTAHACVELFLLRNGYELRAGVEEQEVFFEEVAEGAVSREELSAWIEGHMVMRE